MDRTGIGYIIVAGCLVYGMFVFAGWDQVRTESAVTRMGVTLARQPKAVEVGAEIGMTLAVRIVVGALVSLLIASGFIAYQQARIRELRNGHWEVYWRRRQLPVQKQKRATPTSMLDLLEMIIMREIVQFKRNQGRR